MQLQKEHAYTSKDYWNLPKRRRAKLIDGQFYDMAAPSRTRRKPVYQLSGIIGNYTTDSKGDFKIHPTSLAVNQNADKWL